MIIWVVLAILSFVGMFVGFALLYEGIEEYIAFSVIGICGFIFMAISVGTTAYYSSDFEERCEAKGGVVVDIYRGDDVCLKDEDVLIKE